MPLDSFDKLQHAIALYLAVSWRIGYLMRLSRDEHPCGERIFLTARMPADLRAASQETAYQAPKLKEVVRLIAMLTGFIGRKGDGEPGVKTLWQGMSDLRRAVQATEILREAVSLDSKPITIH